MAKRHGMSRSHSKRDFSKKASRTHVKNGLSGSTSIMRGGIRL